MLMPDNVQYILEQLHKAGFEAYIVGGCVRDMILGIEPYDYDMTTSAEPDQVKALFDRTIDTGIEHGTVTVMMDDEGYEVTTYRLDGVYTDHRRPDSVDFTKSLTEDLKRRDFTINAMAYNPDEGVVDLFNGQEDLKAGVIRCVGKATERFTEDALRMLRAIRFAARFGFVIEAETEAAIRDLHGLIANVSAERIQVELTKTLCSKHPEYMDKLVTFGLIDDLIVEFRDIVGLRQNNSYHSRTVDDHTYECLKHIDPEPGLRWTMYLHDIGKGSTRTTDHCGIDHFYNHEEVSLKLADRIMGRLKFDNKTRKRVLALIKYHDYRFPANEKSVRKAMASVGIDLFEDFLKVMASDVMGKDPLRAEACLKDIEVKSTLYRKILASDQCVTIKDLALSGGDIMALGQVKGPIVGQVLGHLLDQVLEEPTLNTKEALLDEAREYLKAKGFELV